MSQGQGLDSQFDMLGAFWHPKSKKGGYAKKASYEGMLKADEETITFTTAPKYKPAYLPKEPGKVIRSVGRKDPKTFPAWHGFTPEGACTLCHVVEVAEAGVENMSLNRAILARMYRAAACVFGMHLGGLEDKCLQSARYTFKGLNEWFPSAVLDVWMENQVQVHLREFEHLTFPIPGIDAEVSIRIFPELKGSAEDCSARVHRSIASIEIKPKARKSLAWFVKIGGRLENLFSLLTGTSLALETIFIYRDDENAHVVMRRHTELSQYNPLDAVRPTTDELSKAISIWLSAPEKFESVENLALGIIRKGKLFIETEFLSLAQALEGVHRATVTSEIVPDTEFKKVAKKISSVLKKDKVDAALRQRIGEVLSYANGQTFRWRLNKLCDSFTESLRKRMQIKRDELVPVIVATRNSFTHAGGSEENGGPSPTLDLFLLNQKMRALLRGSLLLYVGIPEKQMANILVREATRWR
jgi:hypothetical protein